MLPCRTLFALLSAVMLVPLALFAQLQPTPSETMASRDRLAERITLSDSGTHHDPLPMPTMSIVSPRFAVVSRGVQDSLGQLSIMSVPAVAATADSLPFEPRSASTAFVLSFLIAGGGQLYAGETKKGVVLMAIELAGAGLFVHGLATCDNLLGGECANVQLGLSGALALGSWIVSMVDAPAAARRYNEKYARAHPIVDIEPGRTARFGVSVALGR